MKKLLYILLTCLVGLMVLTGCGKKDDEIIDEGYLYIIDNISHVYSFNDGAITGGTIELQDGILFISTTGYYVMALE